MSLPGKNCREIEPTNDQGYFFRRILPLRRLAQRLPYLTTRASAPNTVRPPQSRTEGI
jgi:hypothetical protein